jgi:predicted enzyme related to lactoylglutathione lyase
MVAVITYGDRRNTVARIIHFEILADDPDRAAAFYAAVLGWTVQSPPGEMRYRLLTTGEDGEAGINGGMMDRHFDQPVINTVQVGSLADVIERVTANGGSVVHGPNEIPGVGTQAYCKDTEENLFAAMQPASR